MILLQLPQELKIVCEYRSANMLTVSFTVAILPKHRIVHEIPFTLTLAGETRDRAVM